MSAETYQQVSQESLTHTQNESRIKLPRVYISDIISWAGGLALCVDGVSKGDPVEILIGLAGPALLSWTNRN